MQPLTTTTTATTATATGISFRKHSQTNPWQARIWADGKDQHLGYFPTDEEAARAYDKAAKMHHKGNAKLNFPDDDNGSKEEEQGGSARSKISRYRGELWLRESCLSLCLISYDD